MASSNAHTQDRDTHSDGLTAKYFFLKNLDLVEHTFSHLQVDNAKEYRLCLFNASLTCKDFLDVALDALWKELDSLMPLLKLLPALQIEDEGYVLSGNVSQADWNRLEYYSRKVKIFHTMSSDTNHPQVHPSTYFRIAQLQSSTLLPSLRHLRYSLDAISMSHIFLFLSPSLQSLELTNIAGFENILVGPFLATLPSPMLNRIVLRSGRMSADTFKKSIGQFKQLRSLELSDAIFMNDFVLREVLGTLPSLTNLTLKAISSESHLAYVPENSSSENGCPKRFDVLESLCVTGSFPLIQHLLDFIDSPCLKSIEVHPVINHIAPRSGPKTPHQSDDRFAPSFRIMVSKWSQSLENLIIGVGDSHPLDVRPRYAISKHLILLTDLHEIQTFHVKDWRMGNMDHDVRSLVMSWPKLTTLILPVDQMPASLTTLRIIAESCPGLHYLQIHLDISTIPSFNPSIESLRHKLEVLSVGSVDPFFITPPTLECQTRVTRHLDSMFPDLKSIETHHGFRHVTWSGIRELVKLCQDVRRAATK